MRALALLSLLAGLTVGQWRPHGLGPRPPSGSQTVLDWQPPAPAASSVASDTLALWHMDETSGVPVDSAGYDGGIPSSAYYGTLQTSVGIFSGSRYFAGNASSGVSGHCTSGPVPWGITSALLSGDYTLSAWVLRTTGPYTQVGEDVLIISDGPVAYSPAMGFNITSATGTANLYWSTGLSSWTQGVTVSAVPLNVWTHMAAVITVTGGGTTRTVKWYINGALDSTTTGLTAPTLVNSAQQAFIGCSENGYWAWAGSIDEMALTARALSAAEVLALYRKSGRWSSPPASTVGPSLALTRASTGTYETSAGHVVNALSGELRCGYTGCLVEPSRANYLLRSEDISAAAWTTYGSLTIAGAACPSADGSVNGTRLTTASGYSSRFQGVTLPATTTTAAQLDVSSSTGSAQSAVLEVLWGASDTAACTCSMSDGSACTVYTLATECYAQASTSSTTPVHLQLLVTTAATHTAFTFAVGPGTITPGMNGTACLGAADLQVGTWMTSHIPTAATSVTRLADVLSVASSGLIGTAGGVYMAVTPEWASAVGGSPKLLSSNAASEADLTLSGGALTWAAHAGTVTSASLGWSAGTAHTVSARWLASSASLLTDGTAVTGTGGTPSISTLYLGGSSSAGAGVAVSRVKVCKGRNCP